MLNIWGVILYLRLPWITAQAGIGECLRCGEWGGSREPYSTWAAETVGPAGTEVRVGWQRSSGHQQA